MTNRLTRFVLRSLVAAAAAAAAAAPQQQVDAGSDAGWVRAPSVRGEVTVTGVELDPAAIHVAPNNGPTGSDVTVDVSATRGLGPNPQIKLEILKATGRPLALSLRNSSQVSDWFDLTEGVLNTFTFPARVETGDDATGTVTIRARIADSRNEGLAERRFDVKTCAPVGCDLEAVTVAP